MRALFLLGLLLSGAAHAADYPPIPGNAGPEDRGAAYNFQPLAARFGAPVIAFAHVDHANGTMLIEYLPQGQDVDHWTRIVTITLIGAGPTASDDAASARQFIKGMRKAVAKGGKELSFAMSEGTHGPQALSSYLLGPGAEEEHIAALTWIETPGYVTQLQAQTRGGADRVADDLKLMKQIAPAR